MHKFIFMSLGLMEAADDQTPGASGGGAETLTVAEAIAAVENKSMPITQRLGVALNALKGANIDTQLTTVKANLVTAQTALTTAQTEVSTLKTEITGLKAQITEFETSSAALEKENKELAAKEQSIEARAQKQVAALGFKAEKLPSAKDDAAGVVTAEDHFAAYAKIQDPSAAGAYYAKHIAPALDKKHGLN